VVYTIELLPSPANLPTTWLIPGKFSIFPMIGTLLKKLITTGKNPLKNKIKLH